MSAPDHCAYPVGTRVRIGTRQGTVHPTQPRVTVQIDGGEIAEVPALCVHLAEGQAPAGPIVEEANNALRELADENAVLLTAVARLVLIATDSWSPAPDEFAEQMVKAEAAIVTARDTADSMAAESWALMRRERDAACAGVVRLSAEASLNTIPDDAEAQFAAALHSAGCVDPCPGHCQAEASTLLDLVRGWSQTSVAGQAAP